MSDEVDNFSIEHDRSGQQFLLRDGDKQIGEINYLAFGEDGKERILYHTGVNKEYEGRGLAGRLAKAALDDTVAEGLTVVPVCPYVRSYLKRHAEYAGHSTPVRPEHLDVVPEEYREQ
ncbi:GNAT family N-acetyltransferase [Raineyella fluvialis]|uniref:GNAT family N-acetyltransferase n=1 Tax=Raineyella fluvialis TaxID=2662261 RepID=A0A5Q2F9Z4_9ACTN|nr:GNAT family N-acetyltransferase [Raineyella fluvialis]